MSTASPSPALPVVFAVPVGPVGPLTRPRTASLERRQIPAAEAPPVPTIAKLAEALACRERAIVRRLQRKRFGTDHECSAAEESVHCRVDVFPQFHRAR